MNAVKTDNTDIINEITSHYTGKRDDLIPILQDVQKYYGYLPTDAMVRVAKSLKISESTVYSVSSFYALFRFVPTGKKMVKVCRGTACHVRGSPRILMEVTKLLHIKPGETTKDMEYSLETVSCFGSCALAPVMVVNNIVYGRMTPAKVKTILAIDK